MKLIDIFSRLWFAIKTRRECCECGAWLGRSNPFGWQQSHGYCVDCSLAAHRKASEYLRGMIAQSLDDHGQQSDGSNIFTFEPAGSSNNSVPTPALETGESRLKGKQSYSSGRDPVDRPAQNLPTHNKALRAD